MNDAHRLMRQAVARGIFPGGVLHVRKQGQDLIHEAYGEADIFLHQPMTRETVFDLASLTKPLATAPAVLRLAQDGSLGLEDGLGNLLPEFLDTAKEEITPAQLLVHTSGFPAHRKYFLELAGLPPLERNKALLRMLVAEPLAYPPGEQQIYSDLGYMVLKFLVEKVAQKRLDVFVYETIYAPLGIDDLFFVDLLAGGRKPARGDLSRFAATEDCPRRGRLLKGAVHDDNVYEAGGIGGQAGLFGTTTSVARFLEMLVGIRSQKMAATVFSPRTLDLMLTARPDRQRTFGFDTPDRENSSAGRLFSDSTVGHLGFTGVSMWLDVDREVTVLLFTNRVHPDRGNDAIKQFRPLLHDAVMGEIVGVSG